MRPSPPVPRALRPALAAALAAALLAPAPAHATWSVAAVDPETGEVGIAGATCGPMVWFIAGLAPGHGVVAAQYATWGRGRDLAVERLGQGRDPDAILRELLREDDKPELRQWAILSADGASAGATGAEVEGRAGRRSGPGWTAQGNTLRPGALDAAAAALEAGADLPLDERLARALVAGADAGGDARCDPEDAAKSAFLYVADPGDPAREPRVEIRARGRGAPWEVQARLAEGQMSCASGGGAGGIGAALLALIGGLGRRRAPRAAQRAAAGAGAGAPAGRAQRCTSATSSAGA
jgi:uncharacterized Ntn-hydrolase superfamily protein